MRNTRQVHSGNQPNLSSSGFISSFAPDSIRQTLCIDVMWSIKCRVPQKKKTKLGLTPRRLKSSYRSEWTHRDWNFWGDIILICLRIWPSPCEKLWGCVCMFGFKLNGLENETKSQSEGTVCRQYSKIIWLHLICFSLQSMRISCWYTSWLPICFKASNNSHMKMSYIKLYFS
jgi:hypothetical protein